MTLRSFLFATQALMAEEGLSFAASEPEVPVPSPAETKQQMQELQKLMSGMQGAPKMPRRARR